jgi:hypothetical protein
MNRRRFLTSAAGAGAATLAVPWLSAATAASDTDLAFANFGAAAEFLLKDFYTRAQAAKVVDAHANGALRHGRSASALHAKALSALLAGAGDMAPAEEDFEFQWPEGTFASAASIASTGRTILHAVLGLYQTAAASAGNADYRVLYASLAASLGQQLGALATVAGGVDTEPFPVALDLESASDALQDYLG